MRTPIFILFLFAFVFFSSLAFAQSACTSVSQYGITWTFDHSYTCGQFVNGDYWVVGPVTISSVSPAWDGTKNGSMLDPTPALSTSDPQGYDRRMDQAFYDWKYSDTVRVSFPTTISGGSVGAKSLVSTIGLNTPQSGGAYVTLDTAAVLTIVNSAPPANSFRPPYASGNKPIWNTSQVNYNLLPSLSTPSGTTLPTFSNWMTRVWLDHGPQVWGSAIHPQSNMPGYPADMSAQVSDISLLSLLNIPQKTTLANRLIQFGIDEYAVSLLNGDGFSANGGFGSGRKWPILFAGLLLNDSAMKSPPTTAVSHVSGLTVSKFGEDGQTYGYNDSFLTTNDIYGYPMKGIKGWDRDSTSLWRITDDAFYHLEYQHKDPSQWTEDGGGKTHTSPTGIVIPDPPSGSNSDYRSESYRQCCTVYTWVGQALAAQLLNAQSVWNHDSYFGQVEFWMLPKVSSYLTTVNQYATFPFSTDYQGSAQDSFVDNMWNTYHSTASPPVCGNGRTEDGEMCDGTSQACTVNGYAGNQSCLNDCSGYAVCSTTQYCGDAVVNGNEICDGDTLACVTTFGVAGTKTCTSLCSGYGICTPNASDGGGKGGPGNTPVVCGNGIKENGEECDGNDFGLGSEINQCAAYSPTYVSGNLICVTCTIVFTSCTEDTGSGSGDSGATGGTSGGASAGSGGGGSGSGGSGSGGGSSGSQSGNETGSSAGGSEQSSGGNGSTGGNSPVTLTCNDGIQNGEETGIDCGGLCVPCLVDYAPDQYSVIESITTLVVIAALIAGAILLLISLSA